MPAVSLGYNPDLAIKAFDFIVADEFSRQWPLVAGAGIFRCSIVGFTASPVP
jgi:hypothetical protein